jgi:hypothetical protein
MNPETPLAILTVLADFLLKVTFAFAVVWSINRLVDLPNRRFLIWLSFLAGAGTYWIWLAIRFVSGERMLGTVQHARVYATSSTPAVWQIPASWAFSLNVALRGAGILYLLVLSYFLVSHIREQMQLRWVLGFGCKPPIDVARTFQSIAESLQLRKCRLLLLTGITSPATLGWIQPTVRFGWASAANSCTRSNGFGVRLMLAVGELEETHGFCVRGRRLPHQSKLRLRRQPRRKRSLRRPPKQLLSEAAFTAAPFSRMDVRDSGAYPPPSLPSPIPMT